MRVNPTRDEDSDPLELIAGDEEMDEEHRKGVEYTFRA